MPSRDARAHLRDILESIDHISSYLIHMDLEAYLGDRKTRSAVERELQIISEAAIRLGDEAGTLCPGPDWNDIRGMGNILRHVYHRVDDQIIWNAVQEDLPAMRKAVDRALTRLQGRTDRRHNRVAGVRSSPGAPFMPQPHRGMSGFRTAEGRVQVSCCHSERSRGTCFYPRHSRQAHRP